MLCISTATAYPAGISYYPQVLAEEHRDNGTQIDVDNANTSSLQLSKQVHDRGARQVPGCLISTSTEPCGSLMVVTVKCRKYSIACVRSLAICATQKTYFKECGKVFDTDCLCQ